MPDRKKKRIPRGIKPERGMAEKDYSDEEGDNDREYEPLQPFHQPL